MFWGIIGPEIVLAVAIGQYASAGRSVDRFRKLGCSQWTLRHAFFADMGGILLVPKDSTPFLVNSRQLAYLVQHGYTQHPLISEDEIWDKSKADTMTRVLTLAQAAWLIIQLCGRAIQQLPTTTLELSAAAIVFCTVGTFVCWLQKPSDVHSCISITLESSTAQILLDAGDEAKTPYIHTPLTSLRSSTSRSATMLWGSSTCVAIAKHGRCVNLPTIDSRTYLRSRSLHSSVSLWLMQHSISSGGTSGFHTNRKNALASVEPHCDSNDFLLVGL